MALGDDLLYVDAQSAIALGAELEPTSYKFPDGTVFDPVEGGFVVPGKGVIPTVIGRADGPRPPLPWVLKSLEELTEQPEIGSQVRMGGFYVVAQVPAEEE